MRHLLHIALLFLCPLTWAGAQPISVPTSAPTPSEREKPTSPTPTSGPRLPPLPGGTELSKETLSIETLGFSMSLPTGTLLRRATAGPDGELFEIIPTTRSWVMSVQPRVTKSPDSTVTDAAELIAQQTLAQRPLLDPKSGEMTHSLVQLLHKELDLRIPGSTTPGARLYFSLPADQSARKDAPRVIKGFTIFKPLPTHFLIYELTTTEEHFASARAAYEVSIATSAFTDPSRAIQGRASAMAAGLAFIQSLDEVALTSALPSEPLTFRLWRPSLGEEVGYRVVTFRTGRRSDLPSTGGGTLTRDNPTGVLVNIRGRVLQRNPSDQGAKIIPVDTQTNAFASFDRSSEAWVTVTAVRNPARPNAKPSVATEIGARSGRSLSIVTRLPAEPEQTIQHTLQGEQYLSLPEVQLLPQLLARHQATNPGALEGELGFYAYRSDTSSVSLRRESIARDTKVPSLLTITSRMRDGQETTRHIVAEGLLIKSELPDGLVWEAVDSAELLGIWKAKGLPVGD
jgi:hypothetical protein